MEHGMDLKAHARHLLGLSRSLVEGYIGAFTADDDWYYLPHPAANMPIWIVAHLGLADNNFVKMFRAGRERKPDGWDALFWYQSSGAPDRAACPPPDEVVAYFRERRQALLEVLDDVTQAELDAPAPPAGARSPIAGAPCMGHAFLFFSIHECLHAGQLSVAHRGLGRAPLFG